MPQYEYMYMIPREMYSQLMRAMRSGVGPTGDGDQLNGTVQGQGQVNHIEIGQGGRVTIKPNHGVTASQAEPQDRFSPGGVINFRKVMDRASKKRERELSEEERAIPQPSSTQYSTTTQTDPPAATFPSSTQTEPFPEQRSTQTDREVADEEIDEPMAGGNDADVTAPQVENTLPRAVPYILPQRQLSITYEGPEDDEPLHIEELQPDESMPKALSFLPQITRSPDEVDDPLLYRTPPQTPRPQSPAPAAAPATPASSTGAKPKTSAKKIPRKTRLWKEKLLSEKRSHQEPSVQSPPASPAEKRVKKSSAEVIKSRESEVPQSSSKDVYSKPRERVLTKPKLLPIEELPEVITGQESRKQPKSAVLIPRSLDPVEERLDDVAVRVVTPVDMISSPTLPQTPQLQRTVKRMMVLDSLPSIPAKKTLQAKIKDGVPTAQKQNLMRALAANRVKKVSPKERSSSANFPLEKISVDLANEELRSPLQKLMEEQPQVNAADEVPAVEAAVPTDEEMSSSSKKTDPKKREAVEAAANRKSERRSLLMADVIQKVVANQTALNRKRNPDRKRDLLNSIVKRVIASDKEADPSDRARSMRDVVTFSLSPDFRPTPQQIKSIESTLQRVLDNGANAGDVRQLMMDTSGASRKPTEKQVTSLERSIQEALAAAEKILDEKPSALKTKKPEPLRTYNTRSLSIKRKYPRMKVSQSAGKKAAGEYIDIARKKKKDKEMTKGEKKFMRRHIMDRLRTLSAKPQTSRGQKRKPTSKMESSAKYRELLRDEEESD